MRKLGALAAALWLAAAGAQAQGIGGGGLGGGGSGGSGSGAGGMFMYSANTITLSGTAFAPIGGGGTTLHTTEADVATKAPSATTVLNLQVQMSAAPGTGATVAVTLRDAATSESLTCTISGASATNCQDVNPAHAFAVAQNDLIDWQVVSTGSVAGTPTITILANNGPAAMGVLSVSGTAGQVTCSPTTGAVICGLPATITQAENFTGGLQSGGVNALTVSGNGSALTGLLWSQLGSTPTTLAGYGITSPLPPAQGGTGENNGSNTITTSLNLTVSGSGNQNLFFGNTGVPWTYNFPQVSGNLAYQVGALTNGHCLQASGTAGGMADAGAACVTTTLAFSGITSATNTTAAMVIGAGASLDYTSTGTINARTLAGSSIGTSGATIPLLSTTNTFGAGQAVQPGAGGTQSAGGTYTMNFAIANSFSATFGAGNLTIANPTNVQSAQEGCLALTQDSVGGRTASWGANFKWSSGTPPVLSTGAGATDLVCWHAVSPSFVGGQLTMAALQ